MYQRSIGAVVGHDVASYDHNRNGKIDLPRNQKKDKRIEVDGVSYKKGTRPRSGPRTRCSRDGVPAMTKSRPSSGPRTPTATSPSHRPGV